MFDEVQKRQRKGLANIGWAMVLFGGGIIALGVFSLLTEDRIMSSGVAGRGLGGGLFIFGAGVTSVVRAKRRSSS